MRIVDDGLAGCNDDWDVHELVDGAGPPVAVLMDELTDAVGLQVLAELLLPHSDIVRNPDRSDDAAGRIRSSLRSC